MLQLPDREAYQRRLRRTEIKLNLVGIFGDRRLLMNESSAKAACYRAIANSETFTRTVARGGHAGRVRFRALKDTEITIPGDGSSRILTPVVISTNRANPLIWPRMKYPTVEEK